jgi:hypothetical protein
MHARGRRTPSLFAACLVIRLALYAALTSFTLFVLLGHQGFKGSFEAVLGWLPVLPGGLAGALILTAIVNVASGVFFSAVQVGLYRRALSNWQESAAERAPREAAASRIAAETAGADPRMTLAVAAAVTAMLLFTHRWVVLAAVTAWLLGGAVLGRHGDRRVVRVGLWLAATLAAGTLIASLVGGLGMDEAASRAVRALLLVLVATWMRATAGSAGLREAFRRALLRLRQIPGAEDAARLLADLDSGRLLAGSATALQERLRGVRRRPIPIADAVLAWAAHEAHVLAPERPPSTRATLRLRPRDMALAASVLLPASALLALVGA